MNLAIRRVAAIMLTAFAVLLAALTHAQVIAGPRYRDDPRNARVGLSRTGRERGPILSAGGVVLARSIADPSDARFFERTYPEGDIYAHTVGYSTFLFGDFAIEATRARSLASGRNSTISGLLTALTGGDLRAQGLRLTLDDEMQKLALQALAGQHGAIVVLEPATGAVLVMASSPSFDPNSLVGVDTGQAGANLEADPAQPLLNRALAAIYAPGSTFKVITAAAVLEAGTVGPETLFPDEIELALPGSSATISNFDGGPCGQGELVTFETAFVRSCNTVFGAIALELTPQELVEQAADFGFNRSIPFDLDVVPSTIPDAASFSGDVPALAHTGIGQRDVRATPLEMALIAAAIANRGLITSPYLVDEVIDADGDIVSAHSPVEWRRAVSPATADVLADLMERVVTSGTGRRASVPGVRVAGKTGTAEVPDGPPHAWFIGFAPVDPEPDQRQIAFAVLVESGGDVGETATGGTLAAPIAQQLVKAWSDRGN